MQVLVDAITPYVDWLGLQLNMGKYKEVPFPVLPPNEAHKVVGVFMALSGDYKHQTT